MEEGSEGVYEGNIGGTKGWAEVQTDVPIRVKALRREDA